jgi:glycoside/pentoside/hexuronide:cation symporter, GPH family
MPLENKKVAALKTDIDLGKASLAEIKKQFAETLQKGLHGVCFSPYMEGQNIGDILSESQINRRMAIVAPYAKWVRSFSCTEGNEHIPVAAKTYGLKTMVGAWIDSDKASNEKEIEALIQLAKAGHVDIAVVGNEVLLRKELTEQELLGYINKVKKALPQIPVGYVDAYYQFREYPTLIDACDVLLVNCYPFWEGVNITQASGHLSQMHSFAKNIAKGKKVIVAETGWPNSGTNTHEAQPSEENAMGYFINTQNWAQVENVDVFYFSSFDESWKVRHEGDVGQAWGIWDKHEKLKY